MAPRLTSTANYLLHRGFTSLQANQAVPGRTRSKPLPPAGSAAAVPLADAEALPFFPGRQSIHVCTSEWSPSKPPAGGSRTVG